MREIELKLELDAAQADRLRRSPVLREMADGPPRTDALSSLYYDTEDQAFRAARIALRLRRKGKAWIQTVKRADGEMVQGLSTPHEDETELPSRTLALGLIADDDLREEVIGLARPGIAPVVETRFRRTTWQVTAPDGTVAELALDRGSLIGGEAKAPFIEAELELKSGTPAALFALAAQIFTRGPVRFASASKSERALHLLDGATARAAPLRKARPVQLDPDASVEAAAMQIFGEGLAHAAPNLARILDIGDDRGPHQLRVGLRRLRSSLGAFRGALGRECLQPWSVRAGEIATVAGHLRDMDVLDQDIIGPLAAQFPEEDGFSILLDAIRSRRTDVAAEVTATLNRPDITAFWFDFAGFIEGRGWLDPSDHTQTARLAAPVRQLARKVLTKRWRAIASYGARIAELTIDERHEMRKEIKKLRYLVDAFRSLYPVEDVAAFTAHVKRLQTAFGALNDSAMAEIMLMQPDAPGAGNPVAARAAGRAIGHYLARSDALWPRAMEDWQALAAAGPFWR